MYGEYEQVNGAVANRLQAEIDALRDALDHIARVAMGSRKQTRRNAWIVQRAKSALNGDTEWTLSEKPHGYHYALEGANA